MGPGCFERPVTSKPIGHNNAPGFSTCRSQASLAKLGASDGRWEMNDTNASVLTSLSSALPSRFGPAPLYSHPAEILSASELSREEKRQILSSWASDARAVLDAPTLRMLDNGQTVAIHDILDALQTLDAFERKTDGSRLEDFQPRLGRRRTNRRLPIAFRWRHRDDDDDDPPPCPAVIAPIPRFPTSGAEVELEAA